MEYGSILAIALDRQPLSRSRRVLVQVASEEMPHQWGTRTHDGKNEILNRGTSPILVRNFVGRLAWKAPWPEGARVTELDANGHGLGPARPLPGLWELGSATLYHLLER